MSSSEKTTSSRRRTRASVPAKKGQPVEKSKTTETSPSSFRKRSSMVMTALRNSVGYGSLSMTLPPVLPVLHEPLKQKE